MTTNEELENYSPYCSRDAYFVDQLKVFLEKQSGEIKPNVLFCGVDDSGEGIATNYMALSKHDIQRIIDLFEVK